MNVYFGELNFRLDAANRFHLSLAMTAELMPKVATARSIFSEYYYITIVLLTL